MYVYIYIYMYTLYVSVCLHIYIDIFALCILLYIYTYFRMGCLLDLWNMHFWEAICAGVLKHLGSEHLDPFCSLQTTGWWKSKRLSSPKIDTKYDTHCPYRNKHPKAPDTLLRGALREPLYKRHDSAMTDNDWRQSADLFQAPKLSLGKSSN